MEQEFNEFSEFRESYKSLKHDFGLNIKILSLPCGSILVSYTTLLALWSFDLCRNIMKVVK